MLDIVTAVIGSVDLIAVMWYVYTFVVVAIGIPLIFCPDRLPAMVRNMYNYGKLNDDAASMSTEPYLIRVLRFNKRTFSHFYAFASVYEVLVLSAICWSYYSRTTPAFVITMLDAITGKDRLAVVAPFDVIVVAVLLLFQSVRRWYECEYVSVFSDGKLLFTHYIVGVTFYWGAANSLIAWAPGFTREGFRPDSFESFHCTWRHLVGTALYFWAAWHQYKCTVILADLRKNSKGKVLTKQHKIPRGDWFEYVSCPHMLTEILVYVALNFILSFRNPLFVMLLVFVIVNQTSVALLNQQWYLKTFKDYPKHRKAILPFLL